MKKKLLFLGIVLLFFAGQTIAQTINVSAGWPNTNWSVEGTYDASALLSDPTTTTDFGYDDDAAGYGSTDSVAAVSPIIDVTTAQTNNENYLQVSFDYNYYQTSGDSLSLQYWDADASQWMNWGNASANYSTYGGYCGSMTGNNFTSSFLDISGYTATQLSGFKYRILYSGSSVYGYGFCMGAPTLTSASCIPPTALTASNLMTNSANLGWTENGSAGDWQVEYDTTGFVQGTGTIVSNIGTNPYTLNTLTDNYTYDYYVRSVCSPGDTSIWAGPFTFTTPCNATNVPYTQDFESATTPNMPSCTSIENAGAGNNWKTALITNSGFNSTVLNYSYNYTNPANAWFYTQGINLTAGTQYQVTFNYGNSYAYQEKLITAVGTSPTYSAMADTLGDITTPDNTNKTLQTYYFTAPTSAVYYFGFNAHSPANLNQLYVDSIVVDAAPSCIVPTDLTASNITTNSADIGWTEHSGSTEWQVEYGTTGFAQGTGDTVSGINTNPYSLGSLSPSTGYDYYVRSVCSPGDTSVWAGPFTFTTPQIPVSTFPYTEDWESGTDSWALQNGMETNQWVVGSAVANGGTQSLYVSNDGGTTNAYSTTNSSAVHAYRDFSFPAVAPQINVSFDWQAMGETTQWDKLRVYIAPTSFTPTPGTQISASGTAPTGVVQLGSVNYNGSSSFATESFSLPSGYANTNSRIIFEWSNDGGGGAQPPAAVDNIQVTVPNCIAPFGLATNSVSSTSAEVAWADTTGGTEWQVEYDTTGFTQGTGNIVSNVADTFTTVPILAHSTNDFYVRTVCGPGDTSAWSGPYTFSNFYCTPSGTSTIYGINSITTTGALTNLNNVNSGISPNGYGDFTATDTLIAYPGQTITATVNNTMGSTYSNNYELWIDWNKDFSFEENPTEHVYSSASYEYDPVNISFTIPNVTTPFITRMRVRNGYISHPTACQTGFAYGEAEDYILKIVPTPSCLPVVDLSSDSTNTSEINVYWTPQGTESSWKVEWGASGFTPGTGTEIGSTTVSDTSYMISGLDPSTQYDIYVQADCGSGDLSAWGAVLSQFTSCGTITNLPWTENFDNMTSVGYGVVPHCWVDEGTDFYTGTPTITKSAPNALSIDWGSNDYAWTPKFALTAGTSYTLSFWMIGDGYTGWDGDLLFSGTKSSADAHVIDTFIVNSTPSAEEWYKVSICFTPDSTSAYSFGVHVNSNGYPLTMSFDNFKLFKNTPAGMSGNMNVCQTEGLVNLNSIVNIENTNGTWQYTPNPSAVENDSLINPATLIAGDQTVYYKLDGCYKDSVAALLHVYPPSSAGTDGSITVCRNEPVNLFDGLQGTVDMGGKWYDPSHQLISGSQPNAGTIPGSFNYFYIVSNTVCPADTGLVNVIVDGTCDWTGLENEAFNKLSVFPNPTSNQINIVNPTNESNLKIVVLDMNGRVVLRDNTSLANNEKATLSLGKLDKGIYTLKVSNTKGQKVFKIVKQ